MVNLPDIDALTKFGDPANFQQMKSNAAKRNKKTFGTAFLNALTGRINESRAEAKEWYKEEKLRAQRNLPLVQKREAQKKAVTSMASTLKSKFNVDEDTLMYYLKDGVPAFSANYQNIMKLDARMASEGLTLDSDTVNEMMKLPAEYKDNDKDLTTFINEMYSNAEKINKDAPPKDESGFFDNLVMGASGFLGFDSMGKAERRLSSEKMYGDMSYDEINRLAALGETTTDPFGGIYGTAVLDTAASPYILDSQDVRSWQSEFKTLHKLNKKNEELAEAVVKKFPNDAYGQYAATLIKGSGQNYDQIARNNPEIINYWDKITGEAAAKEVLSMRTGLERAIDQMPEIKKYWDEDATFRNDDKTNSSTNDEGKTSKLEQELKELKFKESQREEQEKLKNEFNKQFRSSFAQRLKSNYEVTYEEYRKLVNGEEVNGRNFVPGVIYYITDKDMYAIEKNELEKENS